MLKGCPSGEMTRSVNEPRDPGSLATAIKAMGENDAFVRHNRLSANLHRLAVRLGLK